VYLRGRGGCKGLGSESGGGSRKAGFAAPFRRFRALAGAGSGVPTAAVEDCPKRGQHFGAHALELAAVLAR